MIYADNAATTPLCKEAYDAMQFFLQEEFANASQPYSFSRRAKKALKESRESIAACIGAEPDEIFFTSGGTESDNWAIKGTECSGIVTTDIEHHAILNSCRRMESFKPVSYIGVDNYGLVNPSVLRTAIVRPDMLVSVMTANNEVGTIEPIAELAKMTHDCKCLFHTDAVQAVGHIKIDVKKLGVDLLSASAHKFNGPKGIGFLYVKKGIMVTPYMDGGGQESGLRAGTENVASMVGMAKALEMNCCHIGEQCLHLRKLEKNLLDELHKEKLDFRRNGINQLPGNLSLSFKKASGEMLLHRLDLQGIMISTGSACDSKNTQLSHVIKAIKVPDEYAAGTIRISLSSLNTEEEAIRIAHAVATVINGGSSKR